jgi:hypothetical protein
VGLGVGPGSLPSLPRGGTRDYRFHYRLLVLEEGKDFNSSNPDFRTCCRWIFFSVFSRLAASVLPSNHKRSHLFQTLPSFVPPPFAWPSLLPLPSLLTCLECPLSNYPSYRRYLDYFGKHLKERSAKPSSNAQMYLHKLRFNSIPSFSISGTCNPVFSVCQVFFSEDIFIEFSGAWVSFFV